MTHKYPDFAVPAHLDFKKGDKLVCVNPAMGSKLKLGETYEATQDTEPGNAATPEPFVFIKGPKGGQIGCYAWRFLKVEAT